MLVCGANFKVFHNSLVTSEYQAAIGAELGKAKPNKYT